jgi:hypothetical protein
VSVASPAPPRRCHDGGIRYVAAHQPHAAVFPLLGIFTPSGPWPILSKMTFLRTRAHLVLFGGASCLAQGLRLLNGGERRWPSVRQPSSTGTCPSVLVDFMHRRSIVNIREFFPSGIGFILQCVAANAATDSRIPLRRFVTSQSWRLRV